MSRPAYRWAHQQQRVRALRALVDGTPCEICGAPMFRSMGSALHLDHVTPVEVGGGQGRTRLVHARCNVRRGNRLRRPRQQPQRQRQRYDRW